MPFFDLCAFSTMVDSAYIVKSSPLRALIGSFFNAIAFRKAKIVYNFGLSECSRVNIILHI